MDVALSWLKIRAELVAVVLALALLRVHALDLAPVVALVPVPGVPGARAVAALRGLKKLLSLVTITSHHDETFISSFGSDVP